MHEIQIARFMGNGEIAIEVAVAIGQRALECIGELQRLRGSGSGDDAMP